LTKQIDHNMPSITPDKDQVEAFKKTRTYSSIPPSSTENYSAKSRTQVQEEQKPASSSMLSKLSTLLIYLLIGGAGYWVYQQNIKMNEIINSAEQRIASLEHQLSATGEEMGESAIEMKVRIETLGKTSDKLWEEMDKLWASAWRKNQSQIKSLQKSSKSLTNLSSTQRKEVTSTLASIKEINDKQISTEYSIDALKEQLKSSENLIGQIKKLSLELSAIESNSQGRDTQQISLASRVTKLSSQNKQLSSQINNLETKLAQALKNIPAKTAPPPVVGQ
jgi:DNA repair exonuclease SbcCD ATPase subunit